ncbi:MAG: YggS family pyridoxal phosphate-dependent enzyme [Actinomycetota bacterium]|nr:YggS family pyridoxal phosphate-dependent enzyme [Actinomycetota bacterium]
MTAPRDEILRNLRTIRSEIETACDRAGRRSSEVLLVAAAKAVPTEAVAWVVEAGVTAVGENYVSELRAMRERVPGARWHFIGTIQTHTAHHVAALADVVETLSGERATERLARRSAEGGRTLEGLIEVDFTGVRSGVSPERVPAFVDRVSGLEGVRLTGLMTVPPVSSALEGARQWFVRLRELRDRIREQHPQVLELSMGMSLDYPIAVEEGATMVRIGTALFGPRTP